MKIKTGIFFGGPSREREVSFTGGRTVFENLDRSVFEPVPVFVDSHRNFILLDWPYLFRDNIRNFFPPGDLLPPSAYPFRIYLESLGNLEDSERDRLIQAVGRRIEPEALTDLIDVAFLALQGAYGEDGQIQRELEALGIPFTGNGVRTSLLGTDKVLQKEWMNEHGFDCPDMIVINRRDWTRGQVGPVFDQAIDRIGFPLVIRPANQGSAIGLSIIDQLCEAADFEEAVNRAFFRELITVERWRNAGEYERIDHLRLLTDLRDGLGFPLRVQLQSETATVHHPAALLQWMDKRAVSTDEGGVFILESLYDEQQVIVESFINGRSFSSIVIRREDGTAVALPPTELIEGKGFDLEAHARQITPIDVSDDTIDVIRSECERLFTELGLRAFARVDGFITSDGRVFLDDANTNPGLLPSALLFHQAAAIGLNPGQLLTYLIRVSLQERLAETPDHSPSQVLLSRLDEALEARRTPQKPRPRVAVILGGSPPGHQLSLRNGQYAFRQLAASGRYEPVPVWLSGTPDDLRFYQLPLALLLSDQADDLNNAIQQRNTPPAVAVIRDQCAAITQRFGSPSTVFSAELCSPDNLREAFDGAFIALYGHATENGPLQRILEAAGLPYTGSEAVTAELTTHHYRTLQTLQTNGMLAPEQVLIKKETYEKDLDSFLTRVESRLSYPLIAKPAHNGYPSSARVLSTRAELAAYTRLAFRPAGEMGEEARRQLRLRTHETMPRQDEVLFEQIVTAGNAPHSLEITCGLMTGWGKEERPQYEIFEPSTVLRTSDQEAPGRSDEEPSYRPPANFAAGSQRGDTIRREVKKELEKAARILNLQSYASLDALVRIYDTRPPEIIFLAVNALPDLTVGGPFLQQAIQRGYQPHEIFDKIQTFAFAKTGKSTEVQRTPAENLAATQMPNTQEAGAPFEPASRVSYFGPPGKEKNSGAPLGSAPKSSLAKNMKETALNYLRETGNFLRSQVFLINFAGIIGLLTVLLLLITWVLSLYTHHGESLQVHNYVGLQVDEARKKARSRSFSVVVSDSIFILDEPPNKVLEQDPKPFSRVKENRRIYLVITKGTPDLVNLPDLVGAYDYDQYTRKLKRLNLRFRIRDRVFDSRLEENTILYFYYNDRKITDADLRKGVKVPMGSVLDFVVTERNTGMVNIPDLVCKRYDAAIFLINSMNLAVGNVYGGVGDNNSAFVWKQEPAHSSGKMVRMGSQIDVYLTSSRPEGCPPELDPSELDDGG